MAARAAGVRVEDLSARTATTQTFANPDGTWSTETSTEPRFVQDRSGRWRDIDTTLVVRDGRLVPAASPASVSLSDGGDSTLATVTTGGKSLDWHWTGKLPVPTVSGATATYKNAVPGGGDLVVTATATGFIDDVVFHSVPASAVKDPGGKFTFTTPVVTHGAKLEGTPTGGAAVSNGAKQLVWGSTPSVYDAKSDPGKPGAQAGSGLRQVPATIGATAAGNPSVAVSVDNSFLTDPSTVYPVTIDPTWSVAPSSDTYADQGNPNGNYDSYTYLRAGDQGSDVQRAFLHFSLGGIHPYLGKDILSASLKLENINANSCASGNVWAARVSSSWNSTTLTWNNQPTVDTTGQSSFAQAYGYSSACPDNTATFDVTAIVGYWAAHQGTNYGIRLKAGSETDPDTWRSYRSVDYTGGGNVLPMLRVSYDSYPATATTPTFSPVTSFTPKGSTTASSYTSDSTPQVSSTLSDPDGGTAKGYFAFFTSKTGSMVASCWSGYVASGTKGSCSPSTALADGTYYVKTHTYDGTDYAPAWSGWGQATIASGTPDTPVVSCPGYADGTWTSTAPASSLTCTITATGSGVSAPGKISYSVDGAVTKTVVITQSTDPAVAKTTVTVSNAAGSHDISATALSPAGKSSTPGGDRFGYGTLALSQPAASPLIRTSTTVPVVAAGPPAATGQDPTATVQWRLASSGQDATTGWTTGPDLPVTANSTGVYVNSTFDTTIATHDQASNTDLDARVPNLLDIQVCLTYDPANPSTTTQCSWSNAPTQVLRVPHAFGNGFPSTDVTGGQVALWTGEFATDATDAQLSAGADSLSISRTAATFDGSAADPASGVFGPGWTTALTGADAGYADAQVIDATRDQGVLVVAEAGTDPMVFAPPGGPARRTTADLPTGAWTAVDDLTQESGIKAAVSGTGTSTVLTLTDVDGTQTTFAVTAAPTTSTDAVFQPTGVQEPGQSNATTYSYDSANRVTRILAPAAAGITCPATEDVPTGCRALAISYASSTTATTGTPGDYAGQVKTISTVVGNDAGQNSTVVASYAYDTAGRLVSVTDPRTSLTTTYGYDGTSHRLASITPPGQAEIDYTYNNSQQLTQVTRLRPSGDSPTGTADEATIVYNIPTNGTAATAAGLPNLSATAVAAWTQPAAPTYGAAVFGPDHPLPATTTAGDLGSADGPYAQAWYTNNDGYTLNTGAYGAGRWLLTDTEYDTHGSPVRELSTSDIAAIQDGTLVPGDAGTLTTYNDDVTNAGALVLPADTEVTDQYQTARWVQLPDGTSAWLRPHIHTDYDQGAPNSGIDPATGLAYGLPTTVTTAAADPSTLADVTSLGITKTGYDNAVPGAASDLGWHLGLAATSSIVMDTSVAGGTSGAGPITTTTLYNALGQVIKNQQPKSNGTDAGMRVSTYYTGGTGSGVTGCDNHPVWQGLVCQTGYAANPATGPAMITTGYSYNDLQQPAVVTETSGATTRTTTSSYDTAGRPTKTSVTVTGLSGSTPVPDVSYGYDPATGLPTTSSPAGGANGGTITTGYDTWGRVKTYTTSTGTTTTSYTAAGQVASTLAGDGTQTSYSYDGTDANGNTERRGLVTSLTATNGNNASTTISAAFDPAGNLVQENYGGGVKIANSYDTAGELTGRVYTGDVTDPNTQQVTTNQPWIGWSQNFDGTGRVVEDWTPDGAALSGDTIGQAATGYARSYTYDPAGRLTQVIDQTATPGAGPVDENGDLTDGTAASCNIRQYDFDANGNRTSKTAIPPAADGTCQTSGTPTGAVTKTWGYDTADRMTNPGYVYDDLGRITTIAQADTPAAQDGGTPGDLALGYYDTDAIHTQTQNGTTLTNTLDAAGRPRTQTTGPTGGSVTSTLTMGYDDASDSPGFETTTGSGGTTTGEAYVDGPDGLLAATLTSTGTVQLAVNNPHGDCVSQITLPASGDAAGLDDWITTDEYGNPTNATTVGTTATNPSGDPTSGLGYGWTGAHQRATQTTGLIQMGDRIYNPITGEFTSSDPVVGGNSTAYIYPQDPINDADLTGDWGINWGSIGNAIGHAASAAGHWAWHHKTDIALTAITFVPIVGEFADGARGLYEGYRLYRAVRAGADGIEATEEASASASRFWLGRGSRYEARGNRYVSRDGTRQWRPPSDKGPRGVESNFDTLRPNYRTQHIRHPRG